MKGIWLVLMVIRGILYEEMIGWKQALKVNSAFNDEAAKEGYVSSFIRLNPFSNDWRFDECDVVISDTDMSSVRQVFYGIRFISYWIVITGRLILVLTTGATSHACMRMGLIPA